MPHTDSAEHLRERADDVRREAKSISRRMRVLTQLAAELETAAADYIAEVETDEALAQPSVDSV